MSFAGIDVAKDHLDLAVRTGEPTHAERFDNTPDGIDRLIEQLTVPDGKDVPDQDPV